MEPLALAILLGIYFAPAIIAHNRQKANLPAIAALNFFAGWTFVGWVVALCWALAVDKPAVRL
jgi:hypothetical protein